MDLETLFERNGIDLERGEIFEQTPGAMPEGFVFEERVEGMMLGLAIGDALGATDQIAAHAQGSRQRIAGAQRQVRQGPKFQRHLQQHRKHH